MLLTTLKILIIHILLLITTIFPQKTLIFGYIEKPKSFIPSEIKNDTEKSVSKLIFRQLYKYNDGVLKEDLVDSTKISDDLKTYNIKIKPNQYWQDGKEITSNDIIYSITKYDALIKDMSIEKIGNYEIKITLSTPTKILSSFLTMGIEPSHIKNNPKLNPIGSTSFYVSKITSEQNIVRKVTLQSFEKNKQYNRIQFKFYDKDENLETAFKLGEINAFISKRDYQFEKGVDRKNISFIGRQYTILFNTTKSTLKDPEVRLKLAQLLDIEKLIKTQHFFEKNLISQGVISHSYATKETSIPPIYDPTVKLTKSEVDNIKKLEILLPNNEEGEQIKSFIEESWGKDYDIELVFEFLDFEDLISKAHDGSFDVLFIGIETTPDPDRYIYWHSTQIDNGLNLAHFEDPRADKALVEGRQTSNQEERIKHYSIFQDVIETKVPAVFLYHPGTTLYTSNKIDISLPKILYYPWDIFQNL